jgi:hypothetical protein
MRCTKCGIDNAADARFCNQCATPFQSGCLKCESRLDGIPFYLDFRPSLPGGVSNGHIGGERQTNADTADQTNV